MEPKKPLDKMEESTGELEPLPDKEELQELTKALNDYLSRLDENPKADFQYKNGTGDLEGNEAALVSVAIRLLNIARYPKEAHFHIDQWSGEFDEGSNELIITKK